MRAGALAHGMRAISPVFPIAYTGHKAWKQTFPLPHERFSLTHVTWDCTVSSVNAGQHSLNGSHVMRKPIGQLPASLLDEVQSGFCDGVRGAVGALWTDSVQELRDASNDTLAELWCMLRTGRYEEGETDAAAYAVGRDLGLAWRRRHA